MDMENIAKTVKTRREELGWSQGKLAQIVSTSQATIDKIENGRSTRSKFLPQIYHALGLPLEGIVSSESVVDGFQRLTAIASHSRPADEIVGKPDLPILSSIPGGSFGDTVIVSREHIDYVLRPEPLAKAKNGYGLYVVGNTMEPVYRHGDLALIHPNIPPRPGDEVLVCSVDKNNEFKALLKLLVGVTDEEWRLKQYNPPLGEKAEFSLNRQEWPICHLVVGNYRRR